MADDSGRIYTLQQFSAELADINREIAEQTLVKNGVMEPSLREHLIERIFNKMHDLKTKYKNNPYINFAGFAITIGDSISVSIAFSFKDQT